MQCYCALARQTARRLTRFYEAELAGAGMNPAQFELLGNLAGRPGCSQGELARRMDVDQTTLSRNLKLLAGLGWVVGCASAKDGRRVEYSLSLAGKEALDAALPHWTRATERVRTLLGDDAAGVWAALELLGAAV